LGNFVSRLKESALWENTLIICLPDHTLARYPERSEGDDAQRNKIPILLIGGAIKDSKSIETLCNQSDLPATILAQMALPIEQFEFSRNILSPSYSYPFAYHTFNNGISLIDSTGYTLYDLDSNETRIEHPADEHHIRANKAKAILQATYNNYSNR
jgi:phosphoglycerol transferase MdoB-like AlkP superfamily enzyme